MKTQRFTLHVDVGPTTGSPPEAGNIVLSLDFAVDVAPHTIFDVVRKDAQKELDLFLHKSAGDISVMRRVLMGDPENEDEVQSVKSMIKDHMIRYIENKFGLKDENLEEVERILEGL